MEHNTEPNDEKIEEPRVTDGQKKRRSLAVASLCAMAVALLLLIIAAVNLAIGYMRGDVTVGAIRLMMAAVVISAAVALIALIIAIVSLCRRESRRRTAVTGLIFSLLVFLLCLTAIGGYYYTCGGLQRDAAFLKLTGADLNVVETDSDGALLRENQEESSSEMEIDEIMQGLQDNQVSDAEEIARYLLTDDDIPEGAKKVQNTGEPSGKSYLLKGSENITNFLLFGLDASDSSDSIMIVSLDRVHEKIKIISIARDSYVKIREWGRFAKLTYAYHWGGAEMSVRTINYNLYMNIENYVAVDFSQMAKIVDYVGGVDVYIDEDEYSVMSRYAGVTVGMCHIDGEAAVKYSRIRKSSATDSDKKRTSRQREVLLSIFSTVKKMSLTGYPQFIRDCLDMCTTSFDAAQLMGMTLEVVSKDYEIEQYFFPEDQVEWWAGLINEQYYYVYDLRRASDRIYRIIYEDLYVSGYDD